MKTTVEYQGYYAELSPVPGQNLVQGRLLYVADVVAFTVPPAAARACFGQVVEDYLKKCHQLGRMPPFVCPQCDQPAEDLLTHAFATALCGQPVCADCYTKACAPAVRVGNC
ncbi:hypothetical protein [Denitratimonas sp. CY0512]|uniref:hypothetical protein n=1 Tax=Denitratimonas sp. CY0512 TaxID=3131940 RepID=UPI0030B4556C